MTTPTSTAHTGKNIQSNITGEMNWKNENVFSIDDVTFVVEVGEALYDAASGEERFVIGKSRRQLETIKNLHYEKRVSRICDLGIYKGGSVMFYYKLFSPEKIVAIDLSGDRVKPLDAYVKKKGLDHVIRTYYGVDQSNEKAVKKILISEMANHAFDMVVDDASHLLHQTRTSFNLLFPYLAPGGYYIIEDWGWAHWKHKEWQENGGPRPDEPPLSNLVFELTMLLASRPDLIESVYLLPAYAVIKKGRGRIGNDPGSFDLSSAYLNRGRKIRLLD